jgi:hypothetical protein
LEGEEQVALKAHNICPRAATELQISDNKFNDIVLLNHNFESMNEVVYWYHPSVTIILRRRLAEYAEGREAMKKANPRYL